MRNSSLPPPADACLARTNSDIIISQSWDGGLTWSSPQAIAAPGDQFMPWGAYDGTGRLRIGYFDRSYDPANHLYGYTVATETGNGTLSFSTTQVSTALSDPTRDNLWFTAYSACSAFPLGTAFLGDYSGIAIKPDGVVALWTDLRVETSFNGRTGWGQNAFFGTAP